MQILSSLVKEFKKFSVRKYEPGEEVEIYKGNYEGHGVIDRRVKKVSDKIWVYPKGSKQSRCLNKSSIRRILDTSDMPEDLVDALDRNPKLNEAFRGLAEELMKEKVSPRSCQMEDALWIAMRAKGE